MLLRSIGHHELDVTYLAYSANGKYLVSSSCDTTVKLWDLKKDPVECIGHFKADEGEVWSVSISPDGALIASTHEDRTVRLWSVEDQSLAGVLKAHKGEVSETAFSPDGKSLVSVGGCSSFEDDRYAEALVWDVRKRRVKGRLVGHTSRICGVDYSLDGSRVATCGWDKTVRLWDSKSFEELDKSSKTEYSGVFLRFAGNHKLISVPSYEEILVWDLPLRKEPVKLRLPIQNSHSLISDGARCIAVDPTRKWMASGAKGGTARLWCLSTQKIISEANRSPGRIIAVAYSPTRHEIALGNDEEIELWDVSSIIEDNDE